MYTSHCTKAATLNVNLRHLSDPKKKPPQSANTSVETTSNTEFICPDPQLYSPPHDVSGARRMRVIRGIRVLVRTHKPAAVDKIALRLSC